jgi:hypothetical protein
VLRPFSAVRKGVSLTRDGSGKLRSSSSVLVGDRAQDVQLLELASHRERRLRKQPPCHGGLTRKPERQREDRPGRPRTSGGAAGGLSGCGAVRNLLYAKSTVSTPGFERFSGSTPIGGVSS